MLHERMHEANLKGQPAQQDCACFPCEYGRALGKAWPCRGASERIASCKQSLCYFTNNFWQTLSARLTLKKRDSRDMAVLWSCCWGCYDAQYAAI